MTSSQRSRRRWREVLFEQLVPSLARYRLELLLLLALVGLGLGWWGFAQYFDGRSVSRPWTSNLYDALGLFTFETGGVEAPLPLVLDIARFVAPTALLAAAIGAFLALFDQQWQRVVARHRARDHVIVVGLGARGLRLAIGMAATRQRCVVVELSDEEHPNLPNARRAGIPVVTTGGANPDLLSVAQLAQTLRQAAIDRARAVIVTTESQRLNARVANVVAELQSTGRAPHAFVEIRDTDTMRALQGHAGGDHAASIEYYNLAERGAKAFLDTVDEHLTIRGAGATRQHLVIVGNTELARNLVIQATRNWSRDLAHYGLQVDDSDRPQVTLVDPDGPSDRDDVAVLRQWEPRIGDAAPAVCALSITPDTPPFAATTAHLTASPANLVVVTATDEHTLLQHGLALARGLDPGTRLWMCAEQSGGLADLIVRDHAPGVDVPRVFHVHDSVLRHEEILRGTDEDLAIALHQTYRRYRREVDLGTATTAGLRPWHELDDEFRQLNRSVVAEVRRTVHAHGLRLVPFRTAAAASEDLPEALVEALARAMHDGWYGEKHRQGWRTGPRDPEQRRHPDMVGWESLSEGSRTFNRTQAQRLPQLFAVAGLQLHPPAGVAERAPGE